MRVDIQNLLNQEQNTRTDSKNTKGSRFFGTRCTSICICLILTFVCRIAQPVKYYKKFLVSFLCNIFDILVDLHICSLLHMLNVIFCPCRCINDLHIHYFQSTADGKQQHFWVLFSVRSGDFHTTFDKWHQKPVN